MKLYYLIIIGILCTLQVHPIGDKTLFIRNNQLVIGADPERGFFGCFLSALNSIAWCEKKKITPVVYWDKNSCFYDPAGYNGHKTNAWEYYFEQVSSGSYKENDPQWQGFRDLEGKGMSLIKDLGEKYNTKESRTEINNVIQKYIKIKPAVLQKVESFYRKYMAGKKTIGIHIRGTDKFTEVKPVEMDTFVQTAHTLAQQYPKCQFFIATDEAPILEEAKKKLKGRVIYYDCYRSKNGQPLHTHTTGYSKAKLGEEVLIEALLLSRCDAFIHTVSNVSMSVLFFNPNISNVLLRNEEK